MFRRVTIEPETLMITLHELPRPQRAVLVLVDALGWRTDEVAELLGVTPASVRDDLLRARSLVGHDGLA